MMSARRRGSRLTFPGAYGPGQALPGEAWFGRAQGLGGHRNPSGPAEFQSIEGLPYENGVEPFSEVRNRPWLKGSCAPARAA